MIKILQSSWSASLAGLLAYLAAFVFAWRPAAVPLQSEPTPSPASTGPSWTFYNPEVDSLIAELKKEKETLGAKEKDLAALQDRLQSERAELNQLTQVVLHVQAEFDQNVTRVREHEVANLKRLAKLYATMSPDGAATVFKAMDDTTVVKVLTLMKETETAPVLEVLAKQSAADAKRVAAISEKLRLSVAETQATKP